MSFPRYPEYKDSGVEWLGEVPAHWEAKPFKHVIQKIESGTSVNAIDTPALEGEYGVLKTSCVYTGEFNPNENKAIVPEEYERASCPVRKNALIVSRMNTPDLVGAAGMTKEEYSEIFLPDRLWQVILNGATPGFAHYWTRTGMYRSQVQMACSGTSSSMQNLGQDQFRGFIFPHPTEGEQSIIAAFLDRETAKIDELISEQVQLIALLKEKRQAVISHAVTKGLNPNVKMKDSGIEWLGEVPEHWDNVALKRISPSLTVGIVVNPSNYVAEEGLPFIYGGDIREGQITFETARRISQEDSLRNEKTRLMAGDLLTVRVGYPGITAVVPPECEGGNCASVMHVRRGNFDSRWLCYVMNSRIVRFQVEVVQYGAAQEQFNISHAVEFRLPRPPANEQHEIANYLDHQSGQFDELISEALLGISLLKERRSALISAAVTGKFDVRGVAHAQ